MTSRIVKRLADGSYIDLGRHWGIAGHYGGAGLYRGEAAKVLDLVFKHQEKK